MASNPIGDIPVIISGDWSDLKQALDDAAQAASAGAQSIADAFNGANIAQAANMAAGQIQVMGQAFADAATQAGKLSDQVFMFGEQADDAIGQVQAALQSLNAADLASSFQSATTSAQALADAVGQIPAPAQQTATAVEQIGDSSSGLAAVKDQFADLQSTIESGAEALALYDIGQWILDQADQFQEATQQIVANTGEIGDDLSTLQGDFQTVFAQVPQSAADVGQALGLITSKLGETGDALDALATTLADVSTITGESLDALASKATGTFNQWQIATDDQIQELTNLLHVAEAAGVPLTQLLQQLTQFGPAAREMDLSLDQTAAMLGSLDQQSQPLQQVFAALRSELNKLAKSDVPDAAASLQTWVDAIKNATTETEAMAIASTAGTRGASALVDAIRSGALDFDNFSGQLNLTTSSINDQKEAAETFGQVWTEVLHQLDVDLGGALSDVGTVLKNLGLAVKDFLAQPAAYAHVAADEIVLTFLGMEEQVLQSFAQHPLLANILGGPGAADAVNAAIQAVGLQIIALSTDMTNSVAEMQQQSQAADKLHASFNDLGGGGGGGGVIPQLGKDFDSLNTDLYNAGETLDKLAAKMPADFADLQAGIQQGMNFSGLDKQFADLQEQLDRTGENMTDFGQAATDAIGGFRVTLAQLIQDENLQKMGDLAQTLDDKMQKLAQTDLTQLAKQIGNVAAVAQQLGQDSPFAKLNNDLNALGITADGTTQKMAKDFSAFDDLVSNSGATLEEVEGAWSKIQGDITKIATAPGGLGDIVSLSEKYLNYLNQAGASQSVILGATVSVYTDQLKAAEAAGTTADNITLIGENLDNAKAKQNAFNDSTQGMLNLYTSVQKEFADAWTQFGTGIADAIVGAKSFGSAMMDVLDQMEKKITELVVNEMLGQLKDSFIQNTVVLQNFGKAFNAIFGVGGGSSSGGSMVGTAVNAGGLGNLPLSSGGSVASGVTQMSNGITQMSTGIISTLDNLVNLLTGIGQLITGIISDIEQAHTNTLLDDIELNTRQTAMFIGSAGGTNAQLAQIDINTSGTESRFEEYLNAFASLMTTVEDIDSKMGSGGGGGGDGTGSDGTGLTENDLELALQTAISNSGLASGTSSVASAGTDLSDSSSDLSDSSSDLSSAASDLSDSATAQTQAAGVLSTAADGTTTFTGTPAQEIQALTAAGAPIPAGLQALANDVAANPSATGVSTAENTPTATTGTVTAPTEAGFSQPLGVSTAENAPADTASEIGIQNALEAAGATNIGFDASGNPTWTGTTGNATQESITQALSAYLGQGSNAGPASFSQPLGVSTTVNTPADTASEIGIQNALEAAGATNIGFDASGNPTWTGTTGNATQESITQALSAYLGQGSNAGPASFSSAIQSQSATPLATGETPAALPAWAVAADTAEYQNTQLGGLLNQQTQDTQEQSYLEGITSPTAAQSSQLTAIQSELQTIASEITAATPNYGTQITAPTLTPAQEQALISAANNLGSGAVPQLISPTFNVTINTSSQQTAAQIGTTTVNALRSLASQLKY